MAWPEDSLLKGRVGTVLKGLSRKAPAVHWWENSGELSFHVESWMTWSGLVLLLADDGRVKGSSCQEIICDALWAGGKEDVLGSSGCYTGSGTL